MFKRKGVTRKKEKKRRERKKERERKKKPLFSSLIYNPRGPIVSFFRTQIFELLIIKVTGLGSNRLTMFMCSN